LGLFGNCAKMGQNVKYPFCYCRTLTLISSGLDVVPVYTVLSRLPKTNNAEMCRLKMKRLGYSTVCVPF
jgi:hypothetical protein